MNGSKPRYVLCTNMQQVFHETIFSHRAKGFSFCWWGRPKRLFSRKNTTETPIRNSLCLTFPIFPPLLFQRSFLNQPNASLWTIGIFQLIWSCCSKVSFPFRIPFACLTELHTSQNPSQISMQTAPLYLCKSQHWGNSHLQGPFLTCISENHQLNLSVIIHTPIDLSQS